MKHRILKRQKNGKVFYVIQEKHWWSKWVDTCFSCEGIFSSIKSKSIEFRTLEQAEEVFGEYKGFVYKNTEVRPCINEKYGDDFYVNFYFVCVCYGETRTIIGKKEYVKEMIDKYEEREEIIKIIKEL